MVSYTDHPGQAGVIRSHDEAADRPRKRRFRLFSALAAPFRDMDERALHKKHGRTRTTPVRNNSKGNLFVPGAAAPTSTSTRRFSRGDD